MTEQEATQLIRLQKMEAFIVEVYEEGDPDYLFEMVEKHIIDGDG